MGFYAGLCTLWASQVTHALLVGATLCAAEGNLLKGCSRFQIGAAGPVPLQKGNS